MFNALIILLWRKYFPRETTDKNPLFRCLQNGDSGSIVYEERTDSANKEVIRHRPLGMFVGRPADEYMYKGDYPDRAVYQAVVLKQALDDIQEAYSQMITDIQPYTF